MNVYAMLVRNLPITNKTSTTRNDIQLQTTEHCTHLSTMLGKGRVMASIHLALMVDDCEEVVDISWNGLQTRVGGGCG